MSERAATREVVIANRQGLHARPAHAFVTLANQFDARIEIERNGERVDGKSILSILTLGAVQGTRLVLHVRGQDAETALNSLVQLVEQGFADEDLETPEDELAETNGPDDRCIPPKGTSPGG
jgi:phosphocarrier protein HPr